MGQASICGGSGLLRTLVVALAGGRRRRDGCARAGGRGQARARTASPADERRWWLPGDALVEFEGRGGLEQRIGGGIVLGIGGLPQRRAAGGGDAGWRGRLTEVDEDVGLKRVVPSRAGSCAAAFAYGAHRVSIPAFAAITDAGFVVTLVIAFTPSCSVP